MLIFTKNGIDVYDGNLEQVYSISEPTIGIEQYFDGVARCLTRFDLDGMVVLQDNGAVKYLDQNGDSYLRI